MSALLAILPILLPNAFEPHLVEASILPAVVRPGQPVVIALQFNNAGDSGAARDYRVFLHLEEPARQCEAILYNGDHDPLAPAVTWLPGETVLDGPLTITIPVGTPDGPVRVHTGLFDPGGGGRVLDVEAGTFRVDARAPDTALDGPESLSAAELAARRKAVEARVGQLWTLRGEGWEFAIGAAGSWLLKDLRAGVNWTSNPLNDRFGLALLRRGDQRWSVPLTGFSLVETRAGRLVLSQPLKLADGRATGLSLRLTIAAATPAPGGLSLTFETTGQSDYQLERLTALEGALPTTEADDGRAVLPFRLGEPLSAATALPQVRALTTYSPATMQMVALEKAGAALLVTWDHVDVKTITRLAWLDHPLVAGRRALFQSLELTGGARTVRLHPLGRRNYVTAARAYRDVAARAGWRVTRAEQARTRPQVNAMAGAADFKPFVLSRSVPSSRYNSTGREQTNLGYTFAQTAELAEHWRHDLDLDKAFVVLAGWIHRGYDNQHPDILPAAPECGGDAELAQAGERVRALGYPFGLHDNYQDMYEDAPSFDPQYLRKGPDGQPLMGGNWAGGQAWQVRPQDQLALAERNLPEVVKRYRPSIYFIDTVFAWGLVDSLYAKDPWGHEVDLEYKSRLCRYAQERTGLFGSEEGREWAVPVADYLEGLLGHKYDHQPGEVLPVFLMTYHDCVNTYTHQGVRLGPDDDQHVLDTLVYGEMPLYSFSGPRYWERPESQTVPVTVRAEVAPVDARHFDVTYLWSATDDVAVDARAFVHFTNPRFEGEGIGFQDDHVLPPTSGWQAGTVYRDGPRRVAVPEGVLGEFGLDLGLTTDAGRLPLSMRATGNLRYRLGTLTVTAGGIAFEPAALDTHTRPFARPEGWAKGRVATDRFIKNTYEVLSWVHRLTFNLPFEDHRVDDRVEQTRFGDDFRIAVNYGGDPVRLDCGPVLGQVTLPRFGFAVWSPTFVAVHATAAGGKSYPTPALYTARSLDGKPLPQSAQVRLYHGFGGPELGLAGKSIRVERELTTTL